MNPLQILRVEHDDGIGAFAIRTGRNTILNTPELLDLRKRHFEYYSEPSFPIPSEEGLDLEKDDKE